MSVEEERLIKLVMKKSLTETKNPIAEMAHSDS